MLSTKPKPLELPALPGAAEPPPKLRYSPLPGLDVADYIGDYVQHLGQTGVFDYLSTMGSGVDRDHVARLDLAAVGVLGSAFSRMLSPDGGAKQKQLREIVVDHCVRFKVQAWDGAAEDWVALNTAEHINAYLDFGHHLDLVKILGGEALRPLWSRLSSFAGERPSESVKSSPEPSPES